MEQISLGQVYDILEQAPVNDENFCYLCLMSVSPISAQYRLGALVLKKLLLDSYDLISLYRNTDIGKEKIGSYLREPIIDLNSRCLNGKLQILKDAYSEYKQIPWRNFHLKTQKRQEIIALRNQNVPAQYIFDAAYYHFAKESDSPRELMREKLLGFIK